jgi:IS5 family transposase
MQLSFSSVEYLNKTKQTKKDKFLASMEEIIPFKEWCAIIEPYYPKPGKGRRPYPLEVMLRMYLVSLWFNTSDIATEELVQDSRAVRNFVSEYEPDSTTLENFRHLLEKHNLNRKILDDMVQCLREKNVILNSGTIVDATIIAAPNSEKNKDKKPNPEMAFARKGGVKYFGMKAHIGVDSDTALVHSVVTTPADVSDVTMGGSVLTGEESKVWGDAGYIGLDKRIDVCEKFQDGTSIVEEFQTHKQDRTRYERFIKRDGVEFIINKKRSQVITDEDKEAEKEKSRVRIKVEWAFLKLKHLFGFRKTRLRTIEKNHNCLCMMFTLVNILTCKERGYEVKMT